MEVAGLPAPSGFPAIPARDCFSDSKDKGQAVTGAAWLLLATDPDNLEHKNTDLISTRSCAGENKPVPCPIPSPGLTRSSVSHPRAHFLALWLWKWVIPRLLVTHTVPTIPCPWPGAPEKAMDPATLPIHPPSAVEMRVGDPLSPTIPRQSSSEGYERLK